MTTDADYYEEHTESVELWSPGNPLFSPQESLGTWEGMAPRQRLEQLLDQDWD